MAAHTEPSLGATISHAALSAGVAFSWAALSSTAFAQGQDIRLDTIDVTGQQGGEGDYNVQTLSSDKQTAPLLNTPQTVTVIPQAIIQEQGARNLTDVLRNTPGISFSGGENGFATGTDNFQIRGFDASGSVYVDGTRSNGVFNRDIFNIERVEVFKGPAADNGRGGPGGYVNLVTKTPSLQNFFAGEFGVGFDDYRSKTIKRGTIDFNHVLNPTTAFRLNAVMEDSGVPGRDLAEMQPRGIAPSIAFGLGTHARAVFAYEMLRRRDRPDWGVPGATIPGLITYDPRTAGAPRDAFYGLSSDFDHADSDAVMARFEYDLTPAFTLSNQTRWARVDRRARYTTVAAAPYVPATQQVNTQTLFYDRVTTNLTNLTNLSGEFYTGPLKHNVSLGVEVSREESDSGRFGSFNPGSTSLFNPNPDRSPGAPFVPTQSNSIHIDTIAAYAYDTIELNKHWQITGGLRLERYNVGIDSKNANGTPQGALDGYSESHTTLGGKVGVVYKPVEEGSLYASFGVSHLPPGSYLSNPDISRTGDNAFPGFIRGADPVRSLNYEVGVKWDFFDRRLSTAAALFRTEKRTPVSGIDPFIPGDTGGLKGYGQQVVQGIELSIAGRITDEWQVFGGVAFLKSERQHSAYLDLVRRTADPGDYGTFLTTNGDELAFTPNVTGNLWTTYRLPFGLTLGGGLQYVGSSWIGRPDDAVRFIPNGRFGKLPSYTLVHLMASYELRKDVQIRFNVDNVFDKFHVVSTNWPATRAQLGQSRTYRITTSFKF